MKRFLAFFLIPSLVFGQSVTVNTNNLPVSSANPLYTLTSSQKNPFGIPYMDASGIVSTYAAGISFAGTTGVLVSVCGSATKVIALRGFSVTGTSGQTGSLILQLIKTSSVPTGGTKVTGSGTSNDSNNPAATAVLSYYTAAPTPGTVVGTLFAFTQFFATASGGQSLAQSPRELGPFPGTSPIILRGVNECLELYTASAALTTPSIQISIAWTEQTTFP